MIRRIWNKLTDCETAAGGLVVISSIGIALATLVAGAVA